MSRYIDPKNPPSITILMHDGKTRAWDRPTLLSIERQDAAIGLYRHKADPETFCRPMCIVRLKAWK